MVPRTLALMSCIAALASGFEVANAAAAETDRIKAVCRFGMTDDRLIPLPTALAARARALFQLDMPDGSLLGLIALAESIPAVRYSDLAI